MKISPLPKDLQNFINACKLSKRTLKWMQKHKFKLQQIGKGQEETIFMFSWK